MSSEKLSEKMLGEAFECSGMWWLPQRANLTDESLEHRYGTLNYSPGGGIILTILGAFASVDEIMASLSTDISSNLEVVQGLSSEGEKITLLNCSQAGVTVGKVVESSYQVGTVLVGCQFTHSKTVTFEALDIQYTHLSEWARFNVFDISDAWGSKEQQDRIIKYKQPEPVSPAAAGKYTISVVPGVALRLARFPSETVTLEQTSSIHVTSSSSEHITLGECFNLVFNMQGFLSLMMLEGIFPTGVDGTTHRKDSVQRVRLLYEPVGTQKPVSKLRPQDIPFDFQKIRASFGSLLDNFFKDSRMRSVYNQFFSDFYAPAIYTEERFITMGTTIEAFHRRICQKDGTNAAESNALSALAEWIDKMQVQSDLAAELGRRVISSYEMPLRRRLEQLLAKYGKPFIHVVLGEENIDRFLDDVVATRKYYLTYDENLAENALKGYDLFVLYSKLKLLCWVLFLSKIGMSENEIEDALKAQTRDETNRFGFLRHSHG
jgi:ApeA N-terminal domain 1